MVAEDDSERLNDLIVKIPLPGEHGVVFAGERYHAMTPARILQLERLGFLRARPRRSRARHSLPGEAPKPSLEPASPTPPPPKADQPLALLPLAAAWCMDRRVGAGKLSGVGGRPPS